MSESQAFADLARAFKSDADVSAVLHRVILTALSEIPGAEFAGVTFISHHTVSTPAASDELVQAVDRAQYETQEGPCWAAAVDQVIGVVVDDLASDDRWPRFAARAVELGIRSMQSFQLYVADDTIGALNLYARAPAAFGERSDHIGALLATHAALAVSAARTESGLRIALDSRDVIGQAKGILMERHKITAEQAFDLLIVASQHSHRKLRDIAEELAATGELPTVPR